MRDKHQLGFYTHVFTVALLECLTMGELFSK